MKQEFMFSQFQKLKNVRLMYQIIAFLIYSLFDLQVTAFLL